MTKRGFEFMQKWISENISSGPTSENSDALLTAALQRLRDDAMKVGIGWLEMADDPDDIKDAILAAMKG
jgi:hypothetical protein